MKNAHQLPLTKVQEARRERLRQAREKAGFKTAVAAIRHFRWKEETYRSHERGKRGIDDETAVRYADAFGVDRKYLLARDISDDDFQSAPNTGDATPVVFVPVYGRSAGGVWIEGDVTLQEADMEVLVPASGKANPEHQYARKVVGNSVSNRIPDGCYAIFVKREFYPGPIPYGSLVDVHRERAGLHEYSIKAYYGDRLTTDSKELSIQQELSLESEEEDTTVWIEGIAIGFYGSV